MAFPTGQPNTPTDQREQDTNNAAQLWKKGADMCEATEDIFTGFEGGAESIVEVETGTAAGNGHLVHFRNKSGFYGPGKKGDAEFDNATDFETVHQNTNSLAVGLIRNAASWFFTTEDDLGIRGEMASDINEELGKWMGREKTFEMVDSAVHLAPFGTNHNVLSSLNMSAIEDCTAQIRPMGGKPAFMRTDSNGNGVWGMMYLTTVEGKRVLQADTAYKDALKSAGERGNQNPIFNGDTVKMDGNVIRVWDVKDHDGVGPVGSSLNPHAFLGAAVTAGTTAFYITGGGNATDGAVTKHQFFRFFPGMAITFTGGLTVAADSATHQLVSSKFYCAIINPKSAGATANKWGFYEISANNGNKLTVSKRLASADSGIAYAEIGGVAWDSAKNTDAHPSGSLVVWTDANGVPLGRTLALGKGGLRRAYGAFRNKRMPDKLEGGARLVSYIASLYGQAPRLDRTKRVPGVLVLTHPIKYAGWTHAVPA